MNQEFIVKTSVFDGGKLKDTQDLFKFKINYVNYDCPHSEENSIEPKIDTIINLSKEFYKNYKETFNNIKLSIVPSNEISNTIVDLNIFNINNNIILSDEDITKVQEFIKDNNSSKVLTMYSYDKIWYGLLNYILKEWGC